jgi:hypothetical protein
LRQTRPDEDVGRDPYLDAPPAALPDAVEPAAELPGAALDAAGPLALAPSLVELDVGELGLLVDVSPLFGQSFGSARPGLSVASQRLSFCATVFFFALALSVLAVVVVFAAAPVVVGVAVIFSVVPTLALRDVMAPALGDVVGSLAPTLALREVMALGDAPAVLEGALAEVPALTDPLAEVVELAPFNEALPLTLEGVLGERDEEDEEEGDDEEDGDDEEGLPAEFDGTL